MEPPKLAKVTVPLTTTLTAGLAGTLTDVVTSTAGVSPIWAVVVLLPGVGSGVVLATWPVKVWVVTLPAGTV